MPEVDAPTVAEVAPELLEKPLWHKILVKVGVVVWVALSGALAQVLAEHGDAIAAFLVSLLPAMLKGWGGAIAGSLLAGAVAWLRAQQVKRQKEAVIEALKTPPPADIDKFYGK